MSAVPKQKESSFAFVGRKEGPSIAERASRLRRKLETLSPGQTVVEDVRAVEAFVAVHELKMEMNLAKGRKDGQQANRARGEQHRVFWLKEARRILVDKPYLFGNIQNVAAQVAELCRERRVTLNNGRTYKPSTIYGFLVARKLDLRTTQ